MAYTTYTYNQLVKFFTDLTNAHKQIKGFGAGWIRDIEATLGRNTLYPYVWLEPVSEAVAENVTTFSLRLYCLDLVKKDQSNEQEVISDTSQIMRDIILVLREEDWNVQLVGTPILEPVSENFGDIVSGWTAAMDIEVNFANGYCGLPMDAFGGGGSQCEGVTIIDGASTYTIDPGGTYTCVAGGGGSDVYLENTDASFTDTAPCGSTYVLPDMAIDFYVNGVFNQRVPFVVYKDETFNVTL